tara:strand:+ start:3747 stop:4355 length:609 start_codon:yes stop_codon:yes gene_type:complete
MKVLIGYSACQITREAFEKQGHDAWTCDLLPARGNSKNHITADVWTIIDQGWDLGIFHPMCTFLNCASAWALSDPNFEKYPDGGYHQKVKSETLTGQTRREAQDAAVENFIRLIRLPFPKAIENPAPSMVSKYIRPPDQIVQPYEFGHDASKSTGLWLEGLSPLEPTKYVAPSIIKFRGRNVRRWANQSPAGQEKSPPSAER